MSPLKRTDTRVGSDPPSSRRAASIAGTSPVTSRCHLHGSEARETGAQDARRRIGSTSCSPARAAHPGILAPLPFPPRPRLLGGRWSPKMTYGPEAAGRCSPTSLRPAFLPPPGWQALAHRHKRSLTPLLARWASSRLNPGPQPFKTQVNKPYMLPSSGFWCFPLSTHLAFTVHLLVCTSVLGEEEKSGQLHPDSRDCVVIILSQPKPSWTVTPPAPAPEVGRG